MSASAPHRQRSLRDRIHQGISSLSWQGKPPGKSAASYSSYANPTNEAAKPFILATSDNRSLSLDTHGYVNPLDWDIPSYRDPELKLSVGPIASAKKKENRPKSLSAIPGFVAGDASLKSPTKEQQSASSEKKMVTRSITQPEGTIQFTVAASDTLAGIAARFYTTPSELTKLNKLSSRLIFPGQVLYVPKKDAPEESKCVTPPSTPTDKEVTSPLLPNQAKTPTEPQPMSKPGHVERVVSPVAVTEALNRTKSLSPTLSLEEEERRLDEECHKKFLKIQVKHITDGQGIVDGVLLVTPNALMFDPNVSDSLVMEHGTEKYSVTCPMSMVANAALYKDISLMRMKHNPQNTTDVMTAKSTEIYHHEACPKFDSPKKEITGSIEDDDVFSECVCSKSPVKTIPVNDAQNKPPIIKDASAESKPLPKQQDESPSQDLLNLMSDEQVGEDSSQKQNEQTSKPATDCSEESKDSLLENVNKVASDASDNEKSASELESLLIDPSSKNTPPTSDDKRNWYSQLSDISHLPTQIDFSMFRTQKSNSHSEGSDFLLSTSSSDSMDHSSSDSHRVRLLKRLSQPVSWIESFASGSVDSAVEITASAHSTLSKILPHPFSSSSEKDETPPSSAHTTRNFSTSPHSFVDFSSGLFLDEDHDKFNKSVGDAPSTGQSKSSGASDIPSTISASKSALLDSSGSVDSAESVRRLFLNTDAPTSDNASVNKVQIQNMVEDKPDLFTNIDKLIPKPASSFRDPPLYLCLLMGHPTKASKSEEQTLPRHGLISYGQKCIKPEYWFCIPLNQVEGLYNFFTMWAPGVYGDPSTINFKVKGFKLIETDEEFSEDENDGLRLSKRSKSKKSRTASSPRLVGSLFKMVEEHFIPQSPFEQESGSQVVSIGELKSQMSLDVELPLPEMIGKSEIIDDDHRRKISDELPARAEGYPWRLLYSNSEHGFSLKTMYRVMSKYECPVLIVVMDTNNAIFGAMMSCGVKISEHFYGTGESFLFTFHPEYKCFNWTGENNYFIKGAPDSLVIGAGDGLFGLWLDEDLYKGRSHKCQTYDNNTLSSNEDFIIKSVEAWGFM